MRHVQKLICKSRTYQLAVTTNKWNADDKINYSHAMARRLPAEVLFDAVLRVTGSVPNFPGVKPGTRAAQLPDSAIDVAGGLLASLGRPARESACECERSSDIGLGSVMALLSGPAVSGAINDPKNELARLVPSETDDRKLVDEIFLRTLNRHATDKEVASTLDSWGTIDAEHARLSADLAKREEWWAPFTCRSKGAGTGDCCGDHGRRARTTEIAAQVAEAEKIREEDCGRNKITPGVRGKAPGQTGGMEASHRSRCIKTAWVPLEGPSRKTQGIKLKKLEDGSYLASGPVANFVDYTITAESKLEKITGVLLEVLPDESLPDVRTGSRRGQFRPQRTVAPLGKGESESAESEVQGTRGRLHSGAVRRESSINGNRGSAKMAGELAASWVCRITPVFRSRNRLAEPK